MLKSNKSKLYLVPLSALIAAFAIGCGNGDAGLNASEAYQFQQQAAQQ